MTEYGIHSCFCLHLLRNKQRKTCFFFEKNTKKHLQREKKQCKIFSVTKESNAFDRKEYYYMSRKRWLLYSGILFLVFIVFTILLKTVDVQAIGPESSKVGFATINAWFRDLIGVHMIWFQITQFLGYLALCTCVVFAAVGLYQLIRRRSLWRVDYPILVLACYYVLTLIIYFLFEFVVINYRPLIMPEQTSLAASYPSTHTMLAIALFGSAYLVGRGYFRSRYARIGMACAFFALTALTVIGRLVSGVHWLTDVVGGVLISSALLTLFLAFYRPGLFSRPGTQKTGNTGASPDEAKAAVQEKAE